MSKSPKKSLPILPSITILAATSGLALLAVEFYRRPKETITSVVRAGMWLSGIHEDICDIDGVPLHYFYAGRSGDTPIVLVHGLGSSSEVWAGLMLQLGNMSYPAQENKFGVGNASMKFVRIVNREEPILYAPNNCGRSLHLRQYLI